MDFIRVLGPVEVVVNARVRPVTGRHPRAVLSALVLGVGHAVSTDRLEAAVWGDDPPPSAHTTLQTHISHLRKLMDHNAIHFEDGTYTLDVRPDWIDAVRFEHLSRQAADLLASDPAAARRACMNALRLWRGPPFGDLYDADFVYLEARRLDEMRVRTMELRLQADLALGDVAHAAGLLAAAVVDHPYRERLWYLLISALALDGRRVEALRAYQSLREILAEIGLEPSLDLQELETDVLMESDQLHARLSTPAAQRSVSASGENSA